MQLIFNPSSTPFLIGEITLSLSYQVDQLVECRLTWQSSAEQYQHLDRHSFFNLKPELRGSLADDKFFPELAIEI